MKNKQQSQNIFAHKVDLHSTFRDKFQPATNVFVAQQFDHAR